MEHRLRSHEMRHCIVRWVPNVTSQKGPLLVPVLSHISPAQWLPSCFFKNHCSSIIIPPTVPSGLIPAGFPVKTLRAFHFPHHTSQCALFISSSLICSPEQYLIRNIDHEPTFSLYNCFFSACYHRSYSLACYFLLLMSRYIFHHPILLHPQLLFFP
jgi:hypothetical protein